jgi:aspartate racemase
MKTIGVLGGIGPQATMDFEQRVHAVSQRLIPQRGNTGYPPMVTMFLRHGPVLLNEQETPSEPLTLDPRVLAAASDLGEITDFVVIPSNTPHFFLEEISAASGGPVLSIIDVTVQELRRRGVERVGLSGLGIPEVYSRRLEAESIEIAVAPEDARARLDRAIIRLMQGQTEAADGEAAFAVVDALRDQRVDATILGCTEIPLLLGARAEADDLVNPGHLLAEAAVRYALEDDR